ncbi:MAG TPA: acyl carrier protein [Candidatus Limivivens merdigallinarum]|uniref:Acyl carrier protein n=1 Tax=Candidatus Limivivens merdigallinarum TaxID=2840859 RepID=A0A9D1D1Z1_9FIRM|nr:acyl carrier protein [Candidatus Limivivens merdigallinarum]
MFEKLREIICEYVEVPEEAVTEDARFIEDLGFTSFDFMSMVGELEDTFDIEVNEQEVVHIKTVRDAIQYIEKLQEK